MTRQQSSSLGKVEFIALMAAMISFDAFSIDSMIPALQQISTDLNLAEQNHRQYIVTSIFLGFSIGVLFYGFIADAIGRRKPVIIGFLIYSLGVLICLLAQDFELLLIGRMLQGFGVAGPYVLSLTIVRDSYSGSKMAQIMSFIMMVFIIVPIIAPLIGQGILLLSSWRGIFLVMGVFGIVVMTWFWVRQPETLDPKHRQQLHLIEITRQVSEILSHPQSLKYLLALGMMLGAFIAYLSAGQQIYQDIYELGNLFPIVFATVSVALGLSSYFNSRWTQDIALTSLIKTALLIIITASILMIMFGLFTNGNPPLFLFVLYMGCIFFCYGLLFGNITTLALEPMGHIAGSASSIVTSLSTFISIALATLIGSRLEDNVYPIVVGFGLLALVSLALNSNIFSGNTSGLHLKP